MKTRYFGQSATPVSAMGLGCMSFIGFYGAADDVESLRVLQRALDLGVTFWDTANAYGNGKSESLLGRFFAENPGSREKVFLASKFGISRTPEGGRLIDNSPEHLVASLDASLKRLGVEKIDLYYLHRLSTEIPVEETVAAMAKQVAAGKIGAIGLSEVAPDTVRRAHAVHPIAAVQSEYSLWSRGPELGLIDVCREISATLVAFSPLGRGYFGGELSDLESMPPSEFRRVNPRFQPLNWERNLVWLKRFLRLAAEWNMAPATVALAWVLAKAPHIVPIPGTRMLAHLEQDAAAGNIELSAAQMAEIERILPAGFAAGERYNAAQWINVERYG